MALAFQRGSLEGEKETTPWEATSLMERSAKPEGPQSHQEKFSSRTENSNTEQKPHRSSEPPAQTLQSDMLMVGAGC